MRFPEEAFEESMGAFMCAGQIAVSTAAAIVQADQVEAIRLFVMSVQARAKLGPDATFMEKQGLEDLRIRTNREVIAFSNKAKQNVFVVNFILAYVNQIESSLARISFEHTLATPMDPDAVKYRKDVLGEKPCTGT